MAEQTPPLSEDLTDDILYFARAGETADLTSILTSIVADPTNTFSSEAEVLAAARDEYSGNNAVHMAAGNGHFGLVPPLGGSDWVELTGGGVQKL